VFSLHANVASRPVQRVSFNGIGCFYSYIVVSEKERVQEIAICISYQRIKRGLRVFFMRAVARIFIHASGIHGASGASRRCPGTFPRAGSERYQQSELEKLTVNAHVQSPEPQSRSMAQAASSGPAAPGSGCP
jgi:hypothetical protein